MLRRKYKAGRVEWQCRMGVKFTVLKKVVRVGLWKDDTRAKTWRGWREEIWISGERAFWSEGPASAKTLAWDEPSVFTEGQGGQCSWNGVSEGREGGDVFAEIWREDRSGYSKPPEGSWLYSGWDGEPKRGFWAEEEGIWVTLAAELTTDCRGVRVESGDQLRDYWSSQVREHGRLDQGGSDGNGESQ